VTTKRPKSGEWTPLDTAFVAGELVPVRPGRRYPWNHPAVQATPELFVPADLPVAEIRRLASIRANAALDSVAKLATVMDGLTSAGIPVAVPRSLEPGVGVVRCVKRLFIALPGPFGMGRSALNLDVGDLARRDAWFVRRWPQHFEPSTT
jgi:hypothetical protein